MEENDVSVEKKYVGYIIALKIEDKSIEYCSNIPFPTSAPEHIDRIVFTPESRQEVLQHIGERCDVNIQELTFEPPVLYGAHKLMCFNLNSLKQFYQLSSETRDYIGPNSTTQILSRTINELEFHSLNIVLTNKDRYKVYGETFGADTIIATLQKILTNLRIKKLILTECTINSEDIKLLISSNCKTLTTLIFNRCKWNITDKRVITNAILNNLRLRNIQLIDPTNYSASERRYYMSSSSTLNDIKMSHEIYDNNIYKDDHHYKPIIKEEREMNIKLKACLMRNKDYEAAYRACLQFLLIGRYTTSILNTVDKNILVLLAKIIFATRNDEIWSNVSLD